MRGKPLRDVLSAALLVTVLPLLQAQKLVTPGYLFNSDPTCRQIGSTFYLFTTQDPFTVNFERDNNFFKGMFAFHALTTTDFDHWVDHGSILTGDDVGWSAGHALWDGDAGIPANGRYYAYAPFRQNAATEANYGRFDMGVFTADAVFGPYRDVFGGPMHDVDGKPLEGLSPMVVPGEHGEQYLLWGSGDTDKHEVRLARLRPDMTALAEPARLLRVPQRDACGNLAYFESPFLFEARGRWYMTFVSYKDDKGPGCDAKGSYVEYTTADSIYGPFDGAPAKLVYPTAGGHESVQQGVCRYNGEMYLAYHVPYEDLSGSEGDHHRQVSVTHLRFAADGSLVPVHPESDPGAGTPGETHLLLDAFAPRREAAEFHVRAYAEGVRTETGEYRMLLKNGGYLRFNGVDFGAGASGFHAELQTIAGDGKPVVLELRLQSVAGPVVGTVQVGAGSAERITVTGHVDAGRARGVHDLLIVARGEGGDKAGHVVGIASFGFTR